MFLKAKDVMRTQTYPEVGQYKHVCMKTIENRHHVFILEANGVLSVYNVLFNLTSSTEKNLFSSIQFSHCTLESKKATILYFVIQFSREMYLKLKYYSEKHFDIRISFSASVILLSRVEVTCHLIINLLLYLQSIRMPQSGCH